MRSKEHKINTGRRNALKILGMHGPGDVCEKMAARYPITNSAGNWTGRKRDGTIIRP